MGVKVVKGLWVCEDCTVKGWMQQCACVAAARQSPMTGGVLHVRGKVEICVPVKRKEEPGRL